MPSECGLTPAMLAGIGDARIRQRMEACQQGIVQLDSLRQKHTRLMEQLRSQYPDFATPPSRSTSISATATENLHAQYSKTLPPITESPPTPHRYESTTLPQPSSSSSSYAGAGSGGVAPVSASSPPPSTSLPTAMNAAFATRCESPISACMSSHRSSVSIDSGYTSISSDPFLSMISATPMSYSAFRKKASTLERPPTAHTSTTMATTTATDLSPSESPSKSSSSVTLQQQCQKREETNTPNAKNDEEEIESTSEKMIERTIESTTGTAPMRQNRFGRKREDSSWQRPRSMFAMISSSSSNSNNNNNNNNDEENEDKNGDSKNYNLKDKEKESFANVSVASTARKLLDTSTFSQITPPPMSRKFATLQKITPPKPLPRSIYSSSQQPPLPPPPSSSSTSSATIRSLSASSSALHDPHHQPQAQQHSSTISTTRTGFASRPPPQFAKFDSPIQLQNAKVFAPIQNSPKLAQSSPSAFTAAAKNNSSLKPGSTPPTKPRGNISCPIPQPLHQPHHQQQQSRGAYLVPILASAKEILPPRHHRVGIANGNINEMPSLHSAQPASAVLSRQQSSDTNSTNSPLEIRKMFISTPHTITRYGGATTNNSSSITPIANGQNVNRYTFEKSSSSSSSSSQQQHQNYHQSQFSTSLHSSSTPRNRREKCWHESEGL